MSLLDGYNTLGADINKVGGNGSRDQMEGAVTDPLEELELSMSDEELLELKKDWEKKYAGYFATEVEKRQEENEKYYLGKQYPGVLSSAEDRPLVDNVIFEAVETFLPQVTKQNPEPQVTADNTDLGQELAQRVQQMLSWLSDQLSLKLLIRVVARNWTIYFLGAAKIAWDMKQNEITLVPIRPQKLILDPDGTIDVNGEFTGEYIGEIRKDKAGALKKRFKKGKEIIDQLSQGKDGTTLQYIEWWTDEYVFWTLKDNVLGKAKNPHWNHTGVPQTIIGPDGNPVQVPTPPKNHFPTPKKPYVFLSIFNLGLHPYDDTGLIMQNLALQDLINKRLKQIHQNAENTNGGWVVSGEKTGLNKEEAAQAVRAIKQGGTIWTAKGDANSAMAKINGEALPPFHYQQLQDVRTEVLNVFGVRGSVPQGTQSEPTVRGKIIIKGQDADRSSLITDHIEQFADSVYNWFVQMMYVYYDEPHTAAILGKEKTVEYLQLSNQDFGVKLSVTVKEGSLIPKDSLTRANQAIDLATAELLDPITLFDRLEFPNPAESAEKLFLWKNSPIALFPDLQAQQQQMQAQEGAPGQPGQPPPGQASSMQAATPDEATPPIPGEAPPMLNQIPMNQSTQ